MRNRLFICRLNLNTIVQKRHQANIRFVDDPLKTRDIKCSNVETQLFAPTY